MGAKAVDADPPNRFPETVVVEADPKEPVVLLIVVGTAPNALVVLVIWPNKPPVLAVEVEEPSDEVARTAVDVGAGKVVNEELTSGAEVLVGAEVILEKNGLPLLVTEKADEAEPAEKLNRLLAAVVTEGAAVVAV